VRLAEVVERDLLTTGLLPCGGRVAQRSTP